MALGEELIYAALGGEPLGDILRDALLIHLRTGESLDTLLGLTGESSGDHSARTRILRAHRDQLLLRLAEALQADGMSQWQSAKAISAFMTGVVDPEVIETTAPEILDLVDALEAASVAVDSWLYDHKAIYAKLTSLSEPAPASKTD
jgi:hypothetical protein